METIVQNVHDYDVQTSNIINELKRLYPHVDSSVVINEILQHLQENFSSTEGCRITEDCNEGDRLCTHASCR